MSLPRTDAPTTPPGRPSEDPSHRGPLPGRPDDLTQAQKLMVFVLSMSLFGLANIVTEVFPEVTIGPVDLSVSYFVFVPLVMVCLFNPLYAALGAPLGEIVFTDLLMGDFSGLAEIEGYLQMFLALYLAGSLVRDPRRRGQVALAAVVVVVVDKLLSALVDIGKVWVGIEDAELVEGLPESIVAIEAVGLVVDVAISGVLFGVVPALWLVPRLYGKIEPLMGMSPRDPVENPVPVLRVTAPTVLTGLVLVAAGTGFAFLEGIDANVGVWEPGFLDRFGTQFLWVGVGMACTAILAVVLVARSVRARRRDR